MITPRFTLNQDEKSLTIKIRAPYCSLRELEVSVDDNNFIFLCKPYYLRLHLPGNIVENDNTRSSFDSDCGEFSFCYEKETLGEHFADLEFITKFLAPKIELEAEAGERKIVVLTNDGNDEKVQSDKELLVNGFGFAMQGHQNFVTVSYEFGEVFEIDPREVRLDERRKLRLLYEQEKFDSYHYLADFIEDDEIQEIISVKTPWSNLNSTEELQFTNQEKDFLKDLVNVEYNLSEVQIKYCHCGLLDILFAYCYDSRATFFEPNSETGWTINKLSATLCWLEGFEQPKEAIISAFRRSLIYPLHRNFELSQQILADLKQILKLGEKYIVKCLIEIYNVFLGGDCCRYILNNLFIKDYITYIMKWDKSKWSETVAQLNNFEIKKEDLGLNLGDIERGVDICGQLSQLNVGDTDSDDEEDSESYSSESEDSSDSESSSDEEDDVTRKLSKLKVAEIDSNDQ